MLQDPTGVVPQPVLIPFDGYVHVVRHFDGQSTLMEIQARVLRETGQFVAMKELEDLVRRFDEAMIIDGPAFAMFHQQYRAIGTAPGGAGGPFLRRDAPGPARPARAVVRGPERCRRTGGRRRAPERRDSAAS